MLPPAAHASRVICSLGCSTSAQQCLRRREPPWTQTSFRCRPRSVGLNDVGRQNHHLRAHPPPRRRRSPAAPAASGGDKEPSESAGTATLDRDIFSIALPSLATLAVDPLLSAVDSAFVGRVGAEPLASLAVSSSVFTFSLFLFNFLSSATGPLVGQAVFRGRPDEASRTIGLALSFAIVLGLAAAAGLEAGADPLVRLIAGAGDGAEAANGGVVDGAVDYMRVRALGVPAVLFTTAAGGAFRGQLDARAPFAVAIGENVINFALLSVLVFGVNGVSPPLGLVGSAWATVVAEYAGAAGAAAILWNPSLGADAGRSGGDGAAAAAPPRVAPTFAVPKWEDLRALVQASGAVFARSVLLQCVLLYASSSVAAAYSGREGGAASIAAHHVAFQSWLLLAFLADSLGTAGQSLVAKSVGEGDAAGARRTIDRLLQWSLGLGGLFFVAFAAAGDRVAALLTDSPEVQAAAASPLRFVAAMQPVNAVVFLGDGVVTGAGDFLFTAAAMAASSSAAAAAIAASGGELGGVWAGLTVLQGMRGLSLAAWYSALGPLARPGEAARGRGEGNDEQ